MGFFYSQQAVHTREREARQLGHAQPRVGGTAMAGKVKWGHPNSTTTQMKTFYFLSLAVVCGAASAQTPAANPMPDGSRDMYVGLGIQAAPEYVGASEKRTRALPLIQAEWSNGMFISGSSAGWHLSDRPDLEFGPLLAYDAGRDAQGERRGAGGISTAMGLQTGRLAGTGRGLEGLPSIGGRLQGGGFFNYYLTPELRWSNSLLYGSGSARDGVVLNVALQHVGTALAPHHRVSVSAGMNFANRAYINSYFGISPEQAMSSGHPMFAPRGGLRDVYASAGWNWALSSDWMVVSGARLGYLRGDAEHSPLVQRGAQFTVSTGIVFRF